jgi:hypothetical protein
MVPFAAHRRFGDTFKWMLYGMHAAPSYLVVALTLSTPLCMTNNNNALNDAAGDDDTLWYLPGALQACCPSGSASDDTQTAAALS